METSTTFCAVFDRVCCSRDPQFDNRFFVGVTSTGVYCRPICPAPSPREANVRYFPTAAAAADAGFRPYLRCRPEAAPGTPAWLGTSAVVRRALALVYDGALDEGRSTLWLPGSGSARASSTVSSWPTWGPRRSPSPRRGGSTSRSG
jgi:methylphosphotriester-DNA--protein-cysteine methyltransferase